MIALHLLCFGSFCLLMHSISCRNMIESETTAPCPKGLYDTEFYQKPKNILCIQLHWNKWATILSYLFALFWFCQNKSITITLFSNVPGKEAAVMLQGLLHIDAPLLLRGCKPAIVAPTQFYRLIQVGGSALYGQTITVENQLPLRGYELEERQLQRSVWGRDEVRTIKKKKFTKLVNTLPSTTYKLPGGWVAKDEQRGLTPPPTITLFIGIILSWSRTGI